MFFGLLYYNAFPTNFSLNVDSVYIYILWDWMIKTQHWEKKNIRILGVEFDWHSDVKISMDDEGDNNVYRLYVYVTG